MKGKPVEAANITKFVGINDDRLQADSLTTEIRIHQFLTRRSHSPWWRYLSLLANNIAEEDDRSLVQGVVAAYGSTIPQAVAAVLENPQNFSALIETLRGFLPNRDLDCFGLNHLASGNINDNAAQLLSMVSQDNNRSSYLNCASLQSCLALVEKPKKIAFCLMYDSLDLQLSALLLYIHLQLSPRKNRLDVLLQSPLCYALWVANINALELHFSIFTDLLESFEKLRTTNDKSEYQAEMLLGIEFLLGAIPEHELSEFMTSKGLAIMAWTISQSHLVHRMLQIEPLIKKLTKDWVMKLLENISNYQQGNVINTYPLLHSVLTVDMIESWLRKDPYRSVITMTIFTHPALLAKLSHSKILDFSRHFASEDFETVLTSSVFKDMISRDHASTELLMAMCKVKGECDLARYIVKNEFTSFRFTNDQLMELISDVGRTRQPLSTNTDVCAKLSNAQLLAAVSLDSNSFFQLGLERLDNYTAIELIQFAEIYLTSVRISFSESIITSLVARLLKELDRRAEDEQSSMSGSHWLRMMTLHQNIALFIAQHHLSCLSDEDLLEAHQRFGDCVEIEAAVSAELDRRNFAQSSLH